MPEQVDRIRITCPRCDHHIVTVSEDHHFEDDLICPGCGATIEHPTLAERLLERAEAALTGASSGEDSESKE